MNARKFSLRSHFSRAYIQQRKKTSFIPQNIKMFWKRSNNFQFEGRLGRREGDRHPKQEGAFETAKLKWKRVWRKAIFFTSFAMFQVEGWIMPEMPGVMTDILISMDDRSRFPVFFAIFSRTGQDSLFSCNFFQDRSRFPVFFAIFPRTPIRNYFEHLFQIGLCPHSKMNEESRFVDCEFHQVPLLLQLAARRREAVRHHWHQVPWLPRTSNGFSLIQPSNLEHLTAHWCSGTPSWLDRYSSAGWSRLEDLSRWSRTRRCPCNHRCRWQ